jgi:hypothetical protein
MSGIISGCSDGNGDNPDKKTNSGYVAFDYTCYSVRKYVPLLKEIYQFNEYIRQPTLAGRDSVDRLYFRDVKIFYDEQKDRWTLRAIQTYNNTDFSAILIQTNGKKLNETGAVWTVSGDITESGYTPFEFYIENRDNNYWHITEHDYNTCDMFEYTTQWDVCFRDDGNYTLTGNGTLLSIKSPKLKLEYSITEPMEISENNNITVVSSGMVTILATDVDRNQTEEIFTRILSDKTIEITCGKYMENWNYSIFR